MSRTAQRSPGVVLDSGVLVALDRPDRRTWAMITRLQRDGVEVRTSGGVIAQVWRDGRRQADLARVLPGVEVVPLDDADGRRVGELLAASGTRDVVDGHVALLVRAGGLVLTSDPDDLEALLRARKIDATTIRV